jgi:hypothetical protein
LKEFISQLKKTALVKKCHRPHDWKELALADNAKIKQVFRDAQVDIIIDSDQTLIHFFPELEYVQNKLDVSLTPIRSLDSLS